MPIVTKVQDVFGNTYDISAQGLVDAVTQAAQHASDANAALVAMQQIIAQYESDKADKIHMHKATDVYDLADAVITCQNAAALARVILGEIDTFDVNTAYAANTLILHDIGTQENPDERVWRALEPHNVGDIWDPEKWEQVSLMSILASILDVSFERETVVLTSADADFDGADKQVTLTVLDGNVVMTAQTDANGEATFTVAKGLRYTVNAENIAGYRAVAPKTYKAVQNDRDIIFEYIKAIEGVETVNIVADIRSSGLTAEQQAALLEDLVGKQVIVAITGGQSRTLQLDANLSCSTTIPYDAEYTVTLPVVPSFFCKNIVQIFTASQPQRVLAPIYYYLADDMYIVDNAGNTYTFEQVQNGELANADNALLLHITNSTLAANDADFYIPIQMLRAARQQRAWAGANYEFAAVPMASTVALLRTYENPVTGRIGDWDMHYNTEAIIAGGQRFEPAVTTPAASYCKETTLLIGDTTLEGCLGTALQWEQLSAMNEQVSSWLKQLFDISSPLRNGGWWSSSQNSATYAWYLFNGSLYNGTNFTKTSSIQVLPFFDFR